METARATNGFTPPRFGILLALLIIAAFPQILPGLQTFVVRDYGFFSYPAALFQQDCFRHGELPFWNPYNYCGARPARGGSVNSSGNTCRRFRFRTIHDAYIAAFCPGYGFSSL